MRFLAVVLVVAACAGSAQERNEALTDDVRSFQDGVRWKRYEEAAAFVPPDRREKFLDDRDEIDHDLRIDDFEVERVKVGSGASEAIVQVRFTWHLDSVGAVHETVVDERWKKAGKSWHIVSAEHKRGEKMPAVIDDEKPESQPASGPASRPSPG
jgi:hypothetical protein